MKKVTIDWYGNRNDRSPEKFKTIAGEKHPHIIDAQQDVTYFAFAPENLVQPIHKIEVSGTITKIWWAYGAWADRASLNYNLRPDDVIIIDVEE